MRDNDVVGDDDGTSRMPLISLPGATLRYPALPFFTLLSPVMSSVFWYSMEGNDESIQQAIWRDQPKKPEPMRGTLPNTDQPRIPHSEYLNMSSTFAAVLWNIKLLLAGRFALLSSSLS